MCLALFAIHQHPDYPFILLHNRDERYDRASAALQTWDNYPEVLGGRDLVSKGSWLAINQQNGRLAFVTNVRQLPTSMGARSRGWLVSEALSGNESSLATYAQRIQDQAMHYAGFNLVIGQLSCLLAPPTATAAGNIDSFHFITNKPTPTVQSIASGLHGLSNASLNTAWPKVKRGKTAFANWLAEAKPMVAEELFALMSNTERATDHELPNTGIGLSNERWLSPIFIKNIKKNYGTRCSTLITLNKNGQVLYYERTYFSDKRHVDIKNSFNISLN